MSNDELIEIATNLLRPHVVKGRLFGDVGAALLSTNGSVHKGVSVDTPSWGLCAERSAMASMITTGQYRIDRLVAVWRSEQSGALYVLPPCGVCREFMRSVDPANLEAEIVLSVSRSVKLKDLIPMHEWPSPLDMR